jgi:hypothetical protein
VEPFTCTPRNRLVPAPRVFLSPQLGEMIEEADRDGDGEVTVSCSCGCRRARGGGHPCDRSLHRSLLFDAPQLEDFMRIMKKANVGL